MRKNDTKNKVKIGVTVERVERIEPALLLMLFYSVDKPQMMQVCRKKIF
jgi:hypothetical protein